LKTHTNLFAQLLMALHFQLKTVEDDFFEDVLAKDNFLIATLSLLFANIQGFRCYLFPINYFYIIYIYYRYGRSR
jgi:hypothetical protein